MIRADYDSKANAIAIKLSDVDHADYGDPIGEPLSAVVAVANDRAVEVQVLHPDLGIEEPLNAAAERYDLDAEALIAAAQAALAAPDREITLDVAVRAAA
jgi:hypothetical protein